MSIKELKLKYFCKVKDGTHDTPQYVDESDNTFPLVTSKDIANGILSFDNAKHISYEDYLAINKRSDVEKYDVIMPMIGTVGNPAIILTDEPFSIKNVALFKTSPNLLKAKYLKYMLDSFYIKEQFNLNSRGGVQSFVSLTVLENLNILMPQDLELIINYLDNRTTKVDVLIDNKVKLINLLEQQRQSIITEAVTKGLNPNVKMKDSGVEWIGEIPEHWGVSKLKNLFILQRGHDLTHEEFREGEVPVYASNGIMGYHNIVTTKGPNITIGRSGSVGKVNYVEGDFWAHNTCIYVKDSKNSYMKYIYYILKSLDMSSLSTQTAVPTLDRKNIQNSVFVHTLDLEEQKEIATYLDRKVDEIDVSVSIINNQITKLKEYRQSLIYEAVTGKIDVRDMDGIV